MREKAALDQVLIKQSTYSTSLDEKLKEYLTLEKQWDSVFQAQELPDLKLLDYDQNDVWDNDSFNEIIEQEIQVCNLYL